MVPGWLPATSTLIKPFCYSQDVSQMEMGYNPLMQSSPSSLGLSSVE